MKRINEITEVNAMKDFLIKLIVDCINTWKDDGIYAVALHIYDSEYEPAVALSYNTEDLCNPVQGDESEEYEKITILAAIGNEQLPIETRVKVQEKALNALFNSPGTKVEVVASNGSTVVSTETASDFVLRLCTTHNLVNLVEVDKSEDSNGRYTYLRVHEIYKK